METDAHRWSHTLFVATAILMTTLAQANAADIEYQLINLPLFHRPVEAAPNRPEIKVHIPKTQIGIPRGEIQTKLHDRFQIPVKAKYDPTYLLAN